MRVLNIIEGRVLREKEERVVLNIVERLRIRWIID